MPLTRYYILENDTTTAGGIVQTTTNPIIFNVGGKKQSCIGDNVWCPACGSMGQIIPSGPRLSFSLGGAMPALNDDLCLCKCNPPPKLINSQTSFKEIIDNNQIAQYQQAQAQYRQSKLQNNLANSQGNDELPNFTVHFRRPDDYQGEYGFDWVRDEYIYEIDEIAPILRNDIGTFKLIKEYQTYQKNDVDFITAMNDNYPNYAPAWLSLFPQNHHSLHQKGVDLLLEIEQDFENDNNHLLDNIVLLLECSVGLKTNIQAVQLSEYLHHSHEQKLDFKSNDLSLSGKNFNRYTNQTFKINIICTQPLSQVGYIKVFAQKGNNKKQVGLLCVYPNSEIKKAVIQPVFINTIQLDSDTHPLKKDEKDKLTQSELNDAIKSQFLNQALIQAEVQPIKELDLYTNYNKQEITEFLLKYKHTDNSESLASYLYYVERKITKDTLGFLHDVIQLYNTLTNEGILNCQHITYLFLVDYVSDDGNHSDAGISLADFTNQQAINLCRTDNTCNHWKNVALVFLNANKVELLHTVRHELGHSFGLAHTFDDENPFYFKKGCTNNIMDYPFQESKDNNPFTGKMFSLFKYQWDKIRNDINLI